MTELESRVRKYILLQYEGESWDFKREWHHERFLLLHDIICMSNLTSDEDGIIIIGVDEEEGFKIKDVSTDPNRKNTQQLVTFLRDKKFAGGIRPTAWVDSVEIDGKKIDVIVVKNLKRTPYYLDADFEKLRAYHIYTRVGDTNTPIDKSADVDKVEILWKKRFGIDKPAVERFQIYLKDHDNCESVDGEQSFFYKHFPEFVIEVERDEDRNGYEYYCFSQINSKPAWYNIRLKCNGTVIDDTSGICLDGGRFFTAVPNCIFNVEGDYFYGYIGGTLQYELNLMLLSRMEKAYYNSVMRWNECMPVFKSEKEKEEFLEYLKGKEIKLPNEKYHLCVSEKLQNGESGAAYKRQYPKSIGIVGMLDKYRSLF